MKLLALETSSPACSVALQCAESLYERHEVEPREHTRLLLPMIRELLQESATDLNELDALVLGNGPGSFIGMRIAASVAQGLAFASGLKIVPVSSMAAVAAEAFAQSDAEEVLVAQDAHMNEVYLGRYRRHVDELPLPIGGERLQAIAAIEELDAAGAASRLAAGFGWQRYPELLALNARRIGGVSDVHYPRAACLLGLAARTLAAGGAVSPEDVEPAYLRQKVAEKPAAAP